MLEYGLYRKICGSRQWESVKTLIFGVHCVNLHRTLKKQRVRFHKRLIAMVLQLYTMRAHVNNFKANVILAQI
jgi:hypothetical protein